MKINECSGRTLAFLGDAVWSLLVRSTLIEDGESKGKTLQKKSISYVSAKAQSAFYDQLHQENFFTEEEEEVYHRGRNSDSGSVPKNTDAQTYRMSTGFEAMLGALYLEGKQERIKEIWDRIRTQK
ncbi:MAG: Mini-ribonuclease 3 [Solobacterium sp.]|jgi:ribonuclease-3 family protein|nr:Mini-ribonuclease 3 [Solobacterium sp.]MCH4227458.1 Mini-ribonuclease 3 [Solobacterium sp.]MCH4282882.1 Mini-ribonuclease 3 [Solobacterium sp.]